VLGESGEYTTVFLIGFGKRFAQKPLYESNERPELSQDSPSSVVINKYERLLNHEHAIFPGAVHLTVSSAILSHYLAEKPRTKSCYQTLLMSWKTYIKATGAAKYLIVDD